LTRRSTTQPTIRPAILRQPVARRREFVATLMAGALGAAVAVMAVGASLLLVLPATIGVGALVVLAGPGSDPPQDGRPLRDRSRAGIVDRGT
jgi:hypothetical protein